MSSTDSLMLFPLRLSVISAYLRYRFFLSSNISSIVVFPFDTTPRSLRLPTRSSSSISSTSRYITVPISLKCSIAVSPYTALPPVAITACSAFIVQLTSFSILINPSSPYFSIILSSVVPYFS